MARLAFLAALLCALGVNADVFLTNPRGSDNKESTATQGPTNEVRLFRSNNAAWWWEHTDQNNANSFGWSTAGKNDGGYNAPGRGRNMYYFTGSILPIEFAVNQGCGSNAKTGDNDNSHHCDIVLQYMCNDLLPMALRTPRSLATLTRTRPRTTTPRLRRGMCTACTSRTRTT